MTNSSLGVKEVKKAQTYEEMIDIISDSDYEGEILSFDLTYKVEKADTEEFRDFIRRMHFHQGSTMPIFKIPYSEGEEKEQLPPILKRAAQGIKDFTFMGPDRAMNICNTDPKKAGPKEIPAKSPETPQSKETPQSPTADKAEEEPRELTFKEKLLNLFRKYNKD